MIPKSTVSKAVSRLERETGTKLMLRTTRSLTLTAAGRAFYDSCLGPIQLIEDAQKSLFGRDSILTGLVRITAPEDLGTQVIAPALGELAKKNSGLCFEINNTDEVVDLIKEGFDLAVRVGKLQTSGLRAKRIGEVTLIPVASPRYLKTKAKISSPQDLQDQDCLALKARKLTAPWILRSSRETARVAVNVRIASNQMSSLLKAAVAGAGVALVPTFLCFPAIAAGELIRVLPEWNGPSVQVSLISPLASTSSARLKVTSEHIVAAIRSALLN